MFDFLSFDLYKLYLTAILVDYISYEYVFVRQGSPQKPAPKDAESKPVNKDIPLAPWCWIFLVMMGCGPGHDLGYDLAMHV